ncbi:MAG: CotH kinase family protein [Candidatus Peribacteraceae bacterium]|nr:CotH kinase family protein [Candidatus Peribacteraceae bacterium]
MGTVIRNIHNRVDVFQVIPAKIPEGVPFYSIKILDDDMRNLNTVLQNEGNVLSDDGRIWISANFVNNNHVYDVKMRVRGDQPNHWENKKKSWRIKFNKNDLFSGMREMNLILPEDRAWFAELLNNKRAKDMNLLQPPMRYVAVSINNSRPMLYLEVEHWTVEMFEKQGRSSNIDMFKQSFLDTFKDISMWDTYIDSNSQNLHSLESANLLLSIINGDNARNSSVLSSLIDLLFFEEELALWYAHSLLAGDGHVVGDNVRLFYDYTLGKFVPVPWDVYLFEPKSITELPINPLWKTLFASAEKRLMTHKILWAYLSDQKRIDEDLQYANEQREIIESIIYKDTQKYQTNREIRKDLNRRMEQILANMSSLKEEISTSKAKVSWDTVLESKDENRRVVSIDVIAEGPEISSISKDDSFGDSSFYMDTGNSQYDETDILISEDVLLDPIRNEGNMYRFFIVGPYVTASGSNSLGIKIINSVTGKPATLELLSP